VYGPGLPPVRLVAIADLDERFATDAARRYGYERAETDWRAVAADRAIDAVSVVVANAQHREIVVELLAAGKHVLCEKPLAPTIEDAETMLAAAEATPQVAAVGFQYRRSPAIDAVRRELERGTLGRVRHLNARFWCDYASDPDRPMSWRYKGAPGSGALADLGSHILDLGETLCGPIRSVRGALLSTFVWDRPMPLTAAVGHAATAVGEDRDSVENEDLVAFSATFADGATGTFSASRVAHGLPASMGFELFAEDGAATFDLARPGEFGFIDRSDRDATAGFRRVLVGPEHPYVAGGLPMDFPGVSHGLNDLFVFQARAFLEQVAGIDGLLACPTFADGLRNLRIMAAIVASARSGGAEMAVDPPRATAA
jgi:predicted dehydrogenase